MALGVFGDDLSVPGEGTWMMWHEESSEAGLAQDETVLFYGSKWLLCNGHLGWGAGGVQCVQWYGRPRDL